MTTPYVVKANGYGFDQFVRDFLACALWTMAADDDGTNPGDDLTIFDFSPESLAELVADCRKFYNEFSEIWEVGGWDDGQAGHDFALTRNGHGAGFWAREFNKYSDDIGAMMTTASHSYGQFDLFVGDNGMVYV